MPEKYDLETMLKEIAEDEAGGAQRQKKMSQDEIKRMLAKKQIQKKGKEQ